MITTFHLLQNSVGLLTRKPLKTVTVLAPAFVLMAMVGVFATIAAPEFLSAGDARKGASTARSGGAYIAALAAFVLSYAMMAILWHRYTLHDMGTQKPISLKLVLGYVWRALALTAIQIFFYLALLIPLIIHLRSSNASAAAPALLSILLSTFVTQLVLLWLSLRLSLILPAAALGQSISMKMSWHYTEPVTRPIWGVAAILALANTLITSLFTLIGQSSPSQRLMIEMPVYVLQGLLIFSVLTTLYSLQARKRA